MGISLISTEKQQEFLFISLDMIRIEYLQEFGHTQDFETVRLALGDIQVDCQLQSRKERHPDTNQRVGPDGKPLEEEDHPSLMGATREIIHDGIRSYSDVLSL